MPCFKTVKKLHVYTQRIYVFMWFISWT